VSRGYARNAELARAAMVVAAGGGLVAMLRRAPELSYGLAGKVMLAAAGVLIVGGLVAVVRTLMRRSGGADR
jgi:hypothetical protein